MSDFSLPTIGSRAKPALSAKAAESGTLLFWAHNLAVEFVRVLPRGRALVRCGEGLVQYMHTTRKADLRMTAGQRQKVADGLLKFLEYREEAGVLWKPKAHLATHLIADCGSSATPGAQAHGLTRA